VLIREAVTRHFGVWREADAGADKVFDPLLGKDTAGPIVVERRYRPAHPVGHLRFLECGALDAAGQPVQDLVPCDDIYFPYDPALADRDELAAIPNHSRVELMANEIVEMYTYGRTARSACGSGLTRAATATQPARRQLARSGALACDAVRPRATARIVARAGRRVA
jgi:hypothetical protein